MPPPPPAGPNDDAAAPATPGAALHGVRHALATARLAAARERAHSQALCARAAHAARAATAARELMVHVRQVWQEWHRVWADAAGSGVPRVVRVCAYCGAAADAGADPFAPASWRPMPPWVLDHLRAGSLGLRPSHGACPTCASARLVG